MTTRRTESAQGILDDAPRGPGGGALRVCLASPLFPPDYSGAAVRFQRYAPGLHARGVTVDVIAAEVGSWRRNGGYSPGTGASFVPPTDLRIHRVPIPPFPLEGRALARRRKQVFEEAVVARCRDASSRPDAETRRAGPMC